MSSLRPLVGVTFFDLLVEINPRTLGPVAVRVRNRVRTLDSAGLGGGSDPLAAAVDEEVADPDRGLDVVVALIPARRADSVAVIGLGRDNVDMFSRDTNSYICVA